MARPRLLLLWVGTKTERGNSKALRPRDTMTTSGAAEMYRPQSWIRSLIARIRYEHAGEAGVVSGWCLQGAIDFLDSVPGPRWIRTNSGTRTRDHGGRTESRAGCSFLLFFLLPLPLLRYRDSDNRSTIRVPLVPSNCIIG